MFKVVEFVTTSDRKFNAVQHDLTAYQEGDMQIELRQLNMETPELQADTAGEVALASARWAALQVGRPVLVSDVGMEINALGGFPGPYTKYVDGKLPPEKILAMMSDESDRSAAIVDALAFCDPDRQIEQIFTSSTLGSIAVSPSVGGKTTMDRLFVPMGHDMPLGDMSETVINGVWNTDGWRKFVRFFMDLA